jgi:hypothetical protein
MKTYLFNLLFFAIAFTFGLSTVSVYDFAARRLNPPAKTAEIQAIPLAAPSPTQREKTEPAGTTVVETVQTAPDETAEFHADGDYYPVGKMPREFKNIEFVNIVTGEYEKDPHGEYVFKATAPDGYLYTDKEFNFKRVLINNRIVSFETETKNGISYSFEGSIIEVYPEKNSEYSTDNLSGLLIKRKNGKSVAETQITMEYYVGC